MSRNLAIHVIEELLKAGVAEFVVCPGGRNATFTDLLTSSALPCSFWSEERSAAFYALGWARSSQKPVAIIVTSGTAAGELLPAMMEAYYTATPLCAITADRPRRYRGTNAPQCAEQVGLFGTYAPLKYDVEHEERFSLETWDRRAPLHLNVCLEEPEREEAKHVFQSYPSTLPKPLPVVDAAPFQRFLTDLKRPLIVVSSIQPYDREAVAQFLLRLNAPLYLEGTSGLRQDVRLAPLRIYEPDLKTHDGFVRIGGVPTHKLWRDLEGKAVFSVSDLPFSGLPGGLLIHTSLTPFFTQNSFISFDLPTSFYEQQKLFHDELQALFQEEPLAEASLVHRLSEELPSAVQLYLGNSLPIREWDLAATYQDKAFEVLASRGLNGIDGQLSTFFGLCRPDRLNVALLGDLTVLYDMAAPWCLQNLSCPFALVLINNGGGKIFGRLFTNSAIQNQHNLNFEHFAHFWGMSYQKWLKLPTAPKWQGLIEIQPDPAASERFWAKLQELKSCVLYPILELNWV